MKRLFSLLLVFLSFSNTSNKSSTVISFFISTSFANIEMPDVNIIVMHKNKLSTFFINSLLAFLLYKFCVS